MNVVSVPRHFFFFLIITKQPEIPFSSKADDSSILPVLGSLSFRLRLLEGSKNVSNNVPTR